MIAKGYECNGMAIADIYKEELSRHPDAKYKVMKNDWFVISWVDSTIFSDKPTIVYLKSYIGIKFCYVFKLMYPEEEKSSCEIMLKNIFASIRILRKDR